MLAAHALYKKPCLDGILPSFVSNLRGDYHNPLPAKLVHTQKINLRRLVIFAGKLAGSSSVITV